MSRGWVLGRFSGIVADCIVAREKPKPVLMYEVSSCHTAYVVYLWLWWWCGGGDVCVSMHTPMHVGDGLASFPNLSWRFNHRTLCWPCE